MTCSAAAGATLPSDVVDVCSTGGSGLPRINTSTLTALLLANNGLRIAKHGNKAAAGRFGSFNLLEKLGVSTDFIPEQAQTLLDRTNLAFLFAPAIHPVFRHFSSIRTRIGVPTIFNALGPLVNPFLPERQFIGTAFADLMPVIFETAILMEKKHVIVARGNDGLDEISLSGPTRILEYHQGERRDYEIRPEDFGLKPVSPDAVFASSPDESFRIAGRIIRGETDSEHHKLVAINAAFIYSRFYEPLPLPQAYRLMESKLISGGLQETLDRYLECSRPMPALHLATTS